MVREKKQYSTDFANVSVFQSICEHPHYADTMKMNAAATPGNGDLFWELVRFSLQPL